MTSPDTTAIGFVDTAPDPLRYGFADAPDPLETTGIFRDVIPANARVLDIGSGNGASARMINAGKGNELICIEPDADRAAAGRALGIDVRNAVYDQELATELGRFDAVVLGDVLEHLADPARMLRMIAEKSLRPGGLVVASVPNVAHWTVRLNLVFGRFDYSDSGIMDATHLRWFTRSGFVKLFARSGYEVQMYRASAGVWLPVYQKLPFKLIPGKRRIIAFAKKVMPTAFACQHIVVATAARASLDPGGG